RRRTTATLKSPSVRAAMEVRPIVRHWRGLQRGPCFLALHAKVPPDSDLVDCLHLTRREQANPLQFLVGEVRLFLVAGAFLMAQSRLLGDAAEHRFWHAEQEGSSCLRDIFRDLIVHNLPLCRR